MKLKDKSIVVTGGAGFLGRHVCEELKALGCQRVGVPRSAEFDLRTEWGIDRMLKRFEPDIIIHGAATVGGIGANLAEPGRFFYDNAIMGVRLIEAARLAGVAKLVVLGTTCSYPSETKVPFNENDLWLGYPEPTNAPYGVAKRMLLTQCQAYREQYGFNATYLIPVNMYGPHDNLDLEKSHVIPALIRKFEEARLRGDGQVVLWGDGTPTREFLHVRDAARGIVLAAESFDGAQPVNLGSGQEVSIRDLANVIQKATGYQGEIVWDTSKPNGQMRRKLDNKRARDLLGFAATIPLEDGLEETIAWYRQSQLRLQQPLRRAC